MMRRMSGIVLALVFLGAGARSDEAWLRSGEYGDVQIVVSDGASVSEQFAAREFQHYWKQCTGHEPVIANHDTPGKVNVWIGGSGCRFADQLDFARLGDDGFYIRTVLLEQAPDIEYLGLRRPSRFPLRARHLVVAGAPKRGTLYGVYQFFHDYLGVRWLTPEVTHIPAAPESIPAVEVCQVPPIPYRDTNYWIFTRNPAFAAVHRINGNSVPGLSEELGGFMGYAGGFCHTFNALVNPDQYFDEHPEYFSEVNGKRLRKSQLCLTNPDVLRITIDAVRGILRESPPNRRIVSVTQNDWPFWCECANCAAVDREEDSHAGTMIRFVNAVAAAIEEEFPDAYVDTFAYTYTRKPPKHVRPRENVIVRLCSIECDFFRPLSDGKSAANRGFQQDIEAWSRIAKNLYIWDYTQNWHAFMGPHPNIQVLQPNVAFFRDHGVNGMFEQAAHSPGADFEFLKAYILAESLWNPDVDWRALYDEFLDVYYRGAAPFIREYHELIAGKVRRDDYVLSIFTKMEWMDAATVGQAEAIFARAFAAVTDPETRARMERAYLSVQYAALVCPPEFEVVGDTFVLNRPPSITFDEFWARLGAYGVTHLADQDLEELRARLNGETPPRHAETPFARIGNDAYEAWVLPSESGSVVRFHDKARGLELLSAFWAPFEGGGAIQDWHAANPNDPVQEKVIADGYELVEQTPERVAVRAKLPNGLQVTRRMAFAPGNGPMEIRLEIENTSGELRTPFVKLHPEFRAPGKQAPDIRVRRNGQWEKWSILFVGGKEIAMDTRPPENIDAWAMRLRPGKAWLVNEFDPEQLDRLFYFYNRGTGLLNLELYPKLDPLEPGESREVLGVYCIRDELLKSCK